MNSLNHVAPVLWIALGFPLMILGVVTALTLVFSILGIVSMFIAAAVPFGLAVPVLAWLFKSR